MVTSRMLRWGALSSAVLCATVAILVFVPAVFSLLQGGDAVGGAEIAMDAKEHATHS